MRLILKFCLKFKNYWWSKNFDKLQPICEKKWFCLFLCAWNCLIAVVRVGILGSPMGGILNVSFCSLCLFCKKWICIKKNMIHGQSRKNRVFDGVLCDLWKRADVICLYMRKCNIPERYKTVRECTCEWERERERVRERERERPPIIKIYWMWCTDKFKATRKLREWEKEKKR
jgi:hypothetical protein